MLTDKWGSLWKNGLSNGSGSDRVCKDMAAEPAWVQLKDLLIRNGFSSVQSLSRVWLFVTPWTAARQASLSITNSWSLLKLMPIKLVLPSNHLILCHPLLFLTSIFPSIRSFLRSQFFASGSQSIGVSALASVLPMNIQAWLKIGKGVWQGCVLSRCLFNLHAENM